MRQLSTINDAAEMASFLSVVLRGRSWLGGQQQAQQKQLTQATAHGHYGGRQKQQARQRKPRGQGKQEERQRRQAEQDRLREREEQQRQQRAQRHTQRLLVLGRDTDAEPDGLHSDAAAAAAAAAVDKPAHLLGSRKRKQHSPVRVAQAKSGAQRAAEAMAGCTGQQQQAQQQQQQAVQGPAEQGEESLPPMRPASPAGVEAEAAGPMVPPALPFAVQILPSSGQQLSLIATPGIATAQPAGRRQTHAAGGTLPFHLATMPAALQGPGPATSLPKPSPGMLPLMAAHAVEAAQRKVDQAAQAFGAADRQVSVSMLRPLQQLLLALGNKGGAALQEVVAGWGAYSPERQQDLFDAAVVVASEGDWDRLEGQLRLALDLAAEV